MIPQYGRLNKNKTVTAITDKPVLKELFQEALPLYKEQHITESMRISLPKG